MEISFLRAHRMLRLRHVVFLNRTLGQILQSLAKEGVLEQNPRAFFFLPCIHQGVSLQFLAPGGALVTLEQVLKQFLLI